MANFNFNKVILGGRLTADTELKTTSDGVPVVSFTVAINRKTKKDENKADFINCRAYDERAKFINRYFHKGSSISIVGALNYVRYTDDNGQTKDYMYVLAQEVRFVDSLQSGSAQKTDAPAFEDLPEDEDMPF